MRSLNNLILCLVFIIWSVEIVPFNRESFQLKSFVVKATLQTPKTPSIPDDPNFKTETLQNAPQIKRETTCGVGESLCQHRNETTGMYDCFRLCQRCDGVVDCPKATDEEGCPCRSKIASRYICDGTPDCSDFSDEMGCGECFQDEIQCGVSCISLNEFCSRRSCPQFSRALFCTRLSQRPFHSEDDTSYQSKGYLQMRVRNEWLPVCGTMSLHSEVSVKEYCSEVTGVRDEKHNFKLKEISTKASSWAELLIGKDFVYASLAGNCNQSMVIYVDCALPKCQDKREIYDENTPPKIIERIVGGNEAFEEDWRFLVRIIRNGEHQCGGSIINPRWILSASHCFLKISGETFEIEAGTGRTGIYGPNVQRRLVSHVIRHPDFDPFSMSHDVALLRLVTPLQLNKWTTTACFSKNRIKLKKGAICFVAGWGFKAEDGDLAETLQEIFISVLESDKCIKEFQYVDPKKIICAGDEKGKKDSCQGDSGGPMMCKLCRGEEGSKECENASWTQMGIVSYGRGCARPGVPGVYTNVGYFKKWIEDTIGGIQRNSSNLPKIVPKSICGGVQCLHSNGLCLNASRICDDKVDCLNAEDEINCEQRRNDLKSVAEGNPDNQDDYFDYYEYESESESQNDTKLCPENHFQCEVIPGCVPNALLCDETRNCRDGTDEIGCTCVDRIFLTDRSKICDGFYDCPDFTDEFCNLCSKDKWLCSRSSQCISRDKICDAVPDCRYGEDELNCLALAPHEGSLFLDKEGNPVLSDHGILLLYSSSSSTWDPVCEHELDANTADEICSYLGFSPPLSIKYNANLPSTYEIRQDPPRKKRFISFPDPKHDFRSSSRGLTVEGVQLENFKEDETLAAEDFSTRDFGGVFPHRKMIGNSRAGRTRRMACNQVKLECGEKICGKVQSLHFSNVPPLGDASHVPWAVSIFNSGKFLCVGTLIDLQWVIASKERLGNVSLIKDEIHVLGGSNRGLSSPRFIGPREVDLRIDAIVEVDEDLDLVLLHLEKSISLIETMNAVCLQERRNVTWKECLTVVGPDKSPILLTPNNENCKEDKICFPNDRSWLNFCQASPRSGIIACREERKSSSQWAAVAFLEFKTRPKCYNDTNFFIKISKDLISKILQKMVEPAHKYRSIPCDTHKCNLGACISSEEICDAKMTCPDMSDEPLDCPVPVTVCSYFNSTTCECPPNYFKCSDGLCLESSHICDGLAQCVRGEDEENCTCSVILTSLKEKRSCNGVIDCSDESDELRCNCDPKTKFRCFRSLEQQCISRLVVCDAVPDCSEGEDEAYCFTISSTLFPEENALGMPLFSSKGYLLLRIKGKWYTYASLIWTAENSETVCLTLGFRGASKTHRKILNQSLFNQKAKDILPVISEGENEELVVYLDCIV